MMKTVYQYRGGTITRIDYEDGTKTFRASAGFPKPSPLYNLDELDARPGAPVIIVEGEKAADAAKQLFPDYVVVTSPFGAKSAARTDWSPLLVGRPRVILWRDADDAGIKYAEDVLRHVPDACLVAMNGKFPEGWDLADDVPDGVDLEELLTTASPAASQAKKQAKKTATPTCTSPLRTQSANETPCLTRSVVCAPRPSPMAVPRRRRRLRPTRPRS